MNDLLTSKLTRDLRSFRVEKRALALFTGGSLQGGRLIEPAKVLLRLCPEQVVALVDTQATDSRLGDVHDWPWAPDVPVVRELTDLPSSVTDVFIGLALPAGKVLLRSHRSMLERGAQRGLRIWSGMERSIRHDSITDLRQFGPAENVRFNTEPRSSYRLMLYQTTTTTSSAVVANDLADALTQEDVVADWLPSSPAGILARGFGRTLDRAPTRTAPALVQRLIQTLEPAANLIVIEGEGALAVPHDAGVVAARTIGSAPRFHTIVHRVETSSGNGRSDRKRFDLLEELDGFVSRLDGLHQSCGQRSTLLGICLYSTEDDPWPLKELQTAIRDRGLLCVDAEREGVDQLATAARGLLP